MARNVREEWRTNDRFIVEVSNVSHNHLKDGVSVGGFGDDLVEVRADVKEMLDIKIIFVSTTDESTAGISGLQNEVVHTNMLHQFGFLLAMRRAVKRTNDYFLDGSRCSGLDKAPADLNILRNMDWEF